MTLSQSNGGIEGLSTVHPVVRGDGSLGRSHTPKATTEPRSTSDFRYTAQDFERLYNETKAMAFRMALRLTRNRAQAEDLCQTAYVRAWSAFKTFRPDRPFFNWLTKIMKNAFFDEYRLRNELRCPMSMEDAFRRTDDSLGEPPIFDKAPSACDLLVREEEAEQLESILNQLPERDQQLIVLRDVEGLSYEQIAEEMAITGGAVRSRLHRARKALRSKIESHGLELPEFKPEWRNQRLKAIGAADGR